MSSPSKTDDVVLEAAIRAYEADLPHRVGDYAKKTWGHPLHSLCSYQGKLKPSMARTILDAFVPTGHSVLDPLGGVGTIAFEAAMDGRRALTNDLSPLGAIVSAAKMSPPTVGQAEDSIAYLKDRMTDVSLAGEDWAAAEFGLNARVADYYHPDTLEEVLRARKVLAEDGPEGNEFLWASLLHVLHGNRPYALSRTSHPITPFKPIGEAEYRGVVDRVRRRIARALAVPLPAAFTPGIATHGDFRALPALIEHPFDAVVTSPPFMGMRFDRPNWLRLWFCGWGATDFEITSRGFLERQQTKTRDVYADFFSVLNSVTRPEALVILHIGSGRNSDLLDDLRNLGSAVMDHVGELREDVALVETHGVRDRGRTSSHNLVFFRSRAG